MENVIIIQRVLPHYRVPFFIKLAEKLAAEGISFKLIYGQERRGSVPKSVPLNEPWAIRIRNCYVRFPSVDLVWQPCLASLRHSDMIIVEQANRLLINYLLLFLRLFGSYKLAFWGHGQNLQLQGRGSWREKLKALLSTHVDWWFTYTDDVKPVLITRGMAPDRITAVINTVDTAKITDTMQRTDSVKLERLRHKLGLQSDKVCAFCGGMNAEKHIDFLLAACVRIRTLVPDFEMIFIGAGQEQHKVAKAARDFFWIHYVGEQLNGEHVPYLMLSKALLMPGLVGLAVIDSFVTLTPLFTTEIPGHGPEMAYLKSGINGVKVAHDPVLYAKEVVTYLQSIDTQRRLREGCSKSAHIYTLDNMVNNFVEGIQGCLNQG